MDFATVIALFDSPHPFEPLLPSEARLEPLLAKAHDLGRAAGRLAGQPIASELRSLLRAMNSYYSNRIEGQHTRPHELEQALRRDFSQNTALAARQRLAIAHIEAQGGSGRRCGVLRVPSIATTGYWLRPTSHAGATSTGAATSANPHSSTGSTTCWTCAWTRCASCTGCCA